MRDRSLLNLEFPKLTKNWSNFLLIFLFVSSVFAQKKNDLQNKISKTQKEIAVTNKLLKETSKKKAQSFHQLKLLNKKISNRKKLIAQLKSGVKSLTKEIDNTSLLIQTMEADIAILKKKYAKSVYTASKINRKNDLFMWLLSADNFWQAYKRLKFYQQISDYRKTQIQLIKKAKTFVEKKKAELIKSREQKAEYLAKISKQRSILYKNKKSKSQLLSKLKNKESKYKQSLAEKKKDLNQLKSAIANIIKKEKAAGTTLKKDKIYALKSAKFAQNKGRLPWPIPFNKGVVTSAFGLQEYEGGYVDNEGIEISCSQGQPARAIFNGKVTEILNIEFLHKVIIVQHGNYKTLYGNLGNINVSVGQVIKRLDNLGTVYTNLNTGESMLYFAVYQGNKAVNPAHWLAK